VKRGGPRLVLPPTRNHRQLADWINTQQIVDSLGRPVAARVDRVTTSTDSRVAGTRFRRIGKGRTGLVLEIWPAHAKILSRPEERLYRHASSETYRRHSEARTWIEQNLRRLK
jgi:hypothetical protein